MRLVLSGGHLTPAYGLAEFALKKGDSLLVIGSKALDSIEALEFGSLQVPYKQILQVKFDRFHKLNSILKLPLLPVAVAQAIKHLSAFHPDVAIVFGGYNAVPVGIAAALVDIPLVIHEQTAHIGLANQLLKPLARFCAISHLTSRSYFPKNKTIVTGNIIRQVFWTPPKTTTLSLNHKPILYVTGGNQGSKKIIETISSIQEELSRRYQLVIQSPQTQAWYAATDTAYLLHHARLVITRGGANTTAEIMVAGVPSICIPLPVASRDEQTQNALELVKHGAGLLIKQSDLTSQTLLEAINQIEANYHQFHSNASGLKRAQNPNAAASVYELAIKSLHHEAT